MHIITAKSPAKINLFLEITAKLPNGYHELDTLFVKLDFSDLMEFNISDDEGPVTLEIKNNTSYHLEATDENLAVKAAKNFREAFGVKNAVHIKLTKNIPIGAGLGGGSSNAGTTLKVLARHFKAAQKPSGNAAIMAMAKKLGADVPLFVFDEACLRGQGIGEKLTPINCKTQFYAVLVYPNIHISTAEVFKKVKLPGKQEVLTSALTLNKLISGLEAGQNIEIVGKNMFNRLESAVLPDNADIMSIRRELIVRGAETTQMSGSGSTVFGLVSDVQLAHRLSACMRNDNERIVIVAQLMRET